MLYGHFVDETGEEYFREIDVAEFAQLPQIKANAKLLPGFQQEFVGIPHREVKQNSFRHSQANIMRDELILN